jgi:hypothetical protein
MGISICGRCRRWRDFGAGKRRWWMRTGRFVAPSRGIGGPELVRVDACWRQRSPWARVCSVAGGSQRLRLMRGPCPAGSWPTLLVRRSGARRPARLLPSLEHLDDDHASAAAGAWRAEVLRFAQCVDRGRAARRHPGVRARARGWPCGRSRRAGRSAGCGGSRAAGHGAGSGG